MLQQRRGGPSKNNRKVEVRNLQVDFLSIKKRGYNAEICYMKILDKDGKKKMRPITVLADEVVLMPYWVTDKQDVIKSKEKSYCQLNHYNKVRSIALMRNSKAIVLNKKIKNQVKDIF